MAEQTEDGPSVDTGGLAADLAMEEARSDPSLRGDVAAFLRDQRSLIAVQKHHLHLGAWEKRIGVVLRAATLVVGLAFAGGLGWMVWDAAHSQGLLIEPFTVPTDLASRGLGGQAFSSMLLDKLATLQSQTQSNRPAQSYTNNWGDDLKVEIPETGVSLGELRRFLREWLGHDTHITGEVWQGAKGLTITAHASGGTGEPVTGPESDLDALMQKVALGIYRVTQPYRYANYLDRDNFHPGFTDIPAAEAIYRRLSNDPDPVERAYAWSGLGNLAWTVRGNDESAIAYYRKALDANPGASGVGLLFLSYSHLSRPEEMFAVARELARLTPSNRFWVDVAQGNLIDVHASVRRGVQQNQDNPVLAQRNQATGVWILGLLHDGPGLRDWLRDMPVEARSQSLSNNNLPVFWERLLADTALEDWTRVMATEPEVERLFLSSWSGWDTKVVLSRSLRPRLALAKAMTGDIAGAEALIAPAPADCYDCLIIRGQIASEAKQWARADYWFARAVAAAPSIPFAHEDWGRALLARGKPDDAIAQFATANKKGPHFADPLEGWGEALMAKNQSHLALAKFAAAEKYAPNWGRLRLKWGEALTYAGKKDEAQKHFARAATLDLTPSEKSELARHP